jgi:argininosuccinate lyase
MITNNLPHGYHRDLQLLKESTMPAIVALKDCLNITNFMLGHIKVNNNIMDKEQYRYVYSVENVNKLVNEGLSFRDAYLQVGKEVDNGTFEPVKDFTHTHEGSIGNLNNKEIVAKFEAEYN